MANCNCSVNNEYIDMKKCILKALSREKVITNVEFNLTKLVINATVHFSTKKMTSTGRYFPFLYDFWANVCEIVKENPNTNFILRQTKRILEKYSNAAICRHEVSVAKL